MNFIDRQVQFPGQKKLTKVNPTTGVPIAGEDPIYVKIEREEGTITSAGTPINAEILNSLDSDITQANSNASSALSTANSIAATANTALTNSNSAISNAETALTTANSIAATANTALTNSTSAINTANTALTTANTAAEAIATGMGTIINVNGIAQNSISYTTNPQIQIDSKLSKDFSNFSTKTSLDNSDIFVIQNNADTNSPKSNAKTLWGEIKAEMLNLVYPIGSIYTSVVSTSPATLFGGTWTQLQNTFLLAAGSTYIAGATGGEANHILTTAEMPSHNHNNTISVSASQTAHDHTLNSGSGNCANAASLGYSWCYSIGGADNDTSARSARSVTGRGYDIMNTEAPTITVNSSITNANSGSNNSHNNMPPYLVVYMWKRIG